MNREINLYFLYCNACTLHSILLIAPLIHVYVQS
jgi:hypothetical protein